MSAELDLDDVAATSLKAQQELKELRRQLDLAIRDADMAIEHARRIDAKERDALRAALSGLVRIYVTNGVATTPSSEIWDAWKMARKALDA